MVGMMIDIGKYSAYFHDGAVIEIQHKDDEITLSLESAEMDLSEIQDNIQLSELSTIIGKLHLSGVKSIQINDVFFSGRLSLKYDSGNIFDLEIKKNKVEIALIWENFPPKPAVNDFSTIIIQADHIWWETIPDLFDPFC